MLKHSLLILGCARLVCLEVVQILIHNCAQLGFNTDTDHVDFVCVIDLTVARLLTERCGICIAIHLRVRGVGRVWV